MEVSVQVGGGGFHGFRLAEQLNHRGLLKEITAAYPYSLFRYYRHENIPQSKFRGIPTFPLSQLLGRTPATKYIDVSWHLNHIFDFMASKRAYDPDLLVGWPGFMQNTMGEVSSDTTTVIDADHISFPPSVQQSPEFDTLSLPSDTSNLVLQKDVLQTEYEKYGVDSEPVEDRVIKKELREYLAADHIVVPTQFVHDTMVALGINRTKISKAPLGVDTNLFQPRPTHSVDSNNFNVLFVGRISLRKGVQYLLKAVDELDNDDINLQLIGNKTSDIEPILERYSDEFNIIERIPHNELTKWYCKADIFVFPSLLEGFGRVIPEAMACGTPVITTDHTCGVDLIENGKNGYLIPIRDPDTIKKKIQKFYNNPEEVARMGDNARESVLNHTWTDYGDKIHEIYKDIA